MYAFAQGLQSVNTIEKYEKNIELNGNENGGEVMITLFHLNFRYLKT